MISRLSSCSAQEQRWVEAVQQDQVALLQLLKDQTQQRAAASARR